MAKRQSNPYFIFQQFTISHNKCAMKVGTDGVLLGAWVDVANAKNALDIGTGTGLIALMMAQRNSQLTINTIDIEKSAIEQAKENFYNSPFQDRIDAECIALQNYITDCRYDVIVSNPPFFNDSLKSPDKQRTLARHTDSLQVDELIAMSKEFLSDKGKIAIIYPFQKKEDLIRLAKRHGLFVTRLTNVYPTHQSEAKRILIELSKTEVSLEETNLVIEEERHVYSQEFQKLVKDFYL